MTRDYEVSNEKTKPGTVDVKTIIRDTGEVIDITNMPTESFPDFINRNRGVIFPEEIPTPDLNLL